mmetsp:Transcript_16504/g.24455  ORF Transcript_16504/g.24455 Transcript_16504/m.24455 type:complete len:320 (+) Transcript_16504:67-1026(+)
MKCSQKTHQQFKAELSQFVEGNSAKKIANFFQFQSANECSVMAIFGENAVKTASVITESLYFNPQLAIHADISKAITISESNNFNLELAIDYLKDAVVEAKNSCGKKALIIVHHSEAMKDDYILLFNAFFDLFNGNNGYINHNGKTIRAFGAKFLFLFESDEIIENKQTWDEDLKKYWDYSNIIFTNDAMISRIWGAVVLDPCADPNGCLVPKWEPLFNLEGRDANTSLANSLHQFAMALLTLLAGFIFGAIFMRSYYKTILTKSKEENEIAEIHPETKIPADDQCSKDISEMKQDLYRIIENEIVTKVEEEESPSISN